ncbi:MAG: hypothetical protein RR417_04900, partial [Kiritimatiellia bacterium]
EKVIMLNEVCSYYVTSLQPLCKCPATPSFSQIIILFKAREAFSILVNRRSRHYSVDLTFNLCA